MSGAGTGRKPQIQPDWAPKADAVIVAGKANGDSRSDILAALQKNGIHVSSSAMDNRIAKLRATGVLPPADQRRVLAAGPKAKSAGASAQVEARPMRRCLVDRVMFQPRSRWTFVCDRCKSSKAHSDVFNITDHCVRL